MKLFRSARARWNLILCLWAVTLVIGFIGFRQESRDSGFDRSNLEIIYDCGDGIIPAQTYI